MIGDRKSKPETADFCLTLNADCPCTFLDIEDQRKYLDRFPELWHHRRFDSIQRRNVGLLLAWENGTDVVITVDDDNFVTSHDFIGLHQMVGTTREIIAHGSTSGWFDVCSFLQADDGVLFYHRGYPQKERWADRSNL